MKKRIYFISFFLFVVSSSFVLHKFYVSIYQIKYVPEKRALHVTSRIFIDDLNEALYHKYHIKTKIGEKTESISDVDLMKKYILEHFTIKVNGKPVSINYLSNEKENNVIICYYRVTAVTKIKQIEIQNTALFEVDDSQQNIIQSTVFNKKQDLLLTLDNVKGLLKP